MKIKQFIYKLLPQSVKNSIETPVFQEFAKLTDLQVNYKLAHLHPAKKIFVLRYVRVFLMLRVFFDIDNQNNK